MLINIQKKLNDVYCPSCGSKHTLQASLNCSLEDKKCEPVCHCDVCGLSMIVKLPEGFEKIEDESTYYLTCDLSSSSCEIEMKEAA